MNGHLSHLRVMPAVTTAPPPAADAGHAPHAGAGGLRRRGGQPHLRGFTSHRVTPSFGDPPKPLPATRQAGKGERASWQAALLGDCGDGSLQPHPPAQSGLPTVGGAFCQPGAARRRARCRHPVLAFLAATLELSPGTRQRGDLQREGEKPGSSLLWLPQSCVPAGSLPATSRGSSAYF